MCIAQKLESRLCLLCLQLHDLSELILDMHGYLLALIPDMVGQNAANYT
jgi:hypothetical protein